MKKCPIRPITRIPILLADKKVCGPEQFEEDELTSYNMYALGGNHLLAAMKRVLVEFPLNDDYNCFCNIDVEIYVGLTEVEGKFLANTHNRICKTKEFTFKVRGFVHYIKYIFM
ncbi:uncharacterized protein LOC132750370 [Ruditapes philippinarum]|uniref:uncharacterized protein LOC132750370 n=1 Tax=Ruditapes philippinarum TaxID=129788 RepID=UPI00295B1234|nr:uncharacterized protein LOC132750370 [Ruditapes philippinarum]